MNDSSVMRTLKSPLLHQFRSIDILPNRQGFAVGSVEGRISVTLFNELRNYNAGNSAHVSWDLPLGASTSSASLDYGGNANVESKEKIWTIPEKLRKKSFSFKCHRRTERSLMGENKCEVFSVNSLKCNSKLPNIIASAGGDGRVYTWNIDSR